MKPNFDSVCVLGLGYVGLPTAAILASRGVKVLGVWIDLINNTPIPVTAEIIDGQYDISGEMQVDQINLVPEPTTLGLIFIGSLALLRRRSGNSYAEPKP